MRITIELVQKRKEVFNLQGNQESGWFQGVDISLDEYTNP